MRFSSILAVVIKVTGCFEKFLNMTIILGIPSKILGFVVDVQANFESGEINSIIVAKTGKFINNIRSRNNVTIPWENIQKIGEDVILVEI